MSGSFLKGGKRKYIDFQKFKGGFFVKKRVLSCLLAGLLTTSLLSGFAAKPMDTQKMVSKPLVVMMEFPDYNHGDLLTKYPNTPQQFESFDKAHYEDMYFGEDTYVGPDGENYMTFRSYFNQISKGQYDVQGDIFGWLMADEDYANYGSDLSGNNSDQDEALELVREAIQKVAQVPGVDLTDYDVLDLNDVDEDGNYFEPDGVIDYLIIIHAGTGEEWSSIEEDVWPFRCGFTWYGDPNAYEVVTDTYGNTIKADDFLIVEQDAPLGLVCHEFGHALGVADLYGDNDTIEMYSLYSSGSYAGGEFVGCRPTGLGAVGREQLQNKFGGEWASVETYSLEELEEDTVEVTLHEASQTEDNGTDLVRVDLPDYDHQILEIPQGDYAFFSGKGDYLENNMTVDVDLTGVTEAELTFQTWYDIDPEWDYASIQVREKGEDDFVAIPGNLTTDENPNDDTPNNPMDRNPGHGITFSTDGEWVDGEFDLSQFAGKEITLKFNFWTDSNTPMEGIYFDDIQITSGDQVLLSEDAEEDSAFEMNGFTTTNGMETYGHYYLLEWRSHNGVDEGLKEFSNYYKYDKEGGAEKGLLVWYIDERWGTPRDPNQSTGVEGEAYATIVDASQEGVYYVRRPNSAKFDNFEVRLDGMYLQTHDAAFSLSKERNLFFDWGSTDSYDAVRDMNPVFVDEWDYSNPLTPMAGVNLPDYGLRFMVTSESADGSQADIVLTTGNSSKIKSGGRFDVELDGNNFTLDYASNAVKAYVGYVLLDEDGNREEEYVIETTNNGSEFTGKLYSHRPMEDGEWTMSFIVFESEDGDLQAVYNKNLHGYGTNLSRGDLFID